MPDEGRNFFDMILSSKVSLSARLPALALFSCLIAITGHPAEPAPFNGLGMSLGNLSRLSSAQSRSISPENFTGAKGQGGMSTDGPAAKKARELGQGWKISPYVVVPPGETFTLGEIIGSGAIQHIWLTPTGNWRFSILRMYWDGETEPSVEVPVGDFFGMGWGRFAQITSAPVTVNPGRAFNCYWEMPFRKSARLTIENTADAPVTIFYQIDYTLTEVPADAAYLHAQFRRVNPVKQGEVYAILDGVKGRGHYVGTYMAWGVNSTGWWGEGEVKFYLDGDGPFPTICGTGTEDYFGGSYNFENSATKQYQEFNTPYAGMPQVIRPDGLYDSQQRFGLYRWHIMDPVRFGQDLRVTVQDLGWAGDVGPNRRYYQRHDDLASTAFWYQTEPHAPFPKLPSRDALDPH